MENQDEKPERDPLLPVRAAVQLFFDRELKQEERDAVIRSIVAALQANEVDPDQCPVYIQFMERKPRPLIVVPQSRFRQ